MGQILRDYSNPNFWEPVWSYSVVAADAGGGAYYPIPEIVCPVLLDRHVIAVSSTSDSAAVWWRSAGFVSYKVRTGLVVGGQPDTQVAQSYRMSLKNITLFDFPKLSSEYEIGFNIHYWLEQITLNVWKYTGFEQDTTEQKIDLARLRIDGIEQTVDRIEQKVDDLTNYGGN